MSAIRLSAFGLLLALALGAGGCSTVSSLNSAARNLDAYALNPLPPQPAARRGSRILFVAEPTVPGAVATDRIVMKPNAIQVTLLGDGRWVEALTRYHEDHGTLPPGNLEDTEEPPPLGRYHWKSEDAHGS